MSLEDLITRTRDRAARGENQSYPEHAGKALGGGVPPGAVALPVLPCVHGGGDADIIERCPSCSGGGRHVRECEVHGTCTHEPVNPAVMDCARCRREGLGYSTEVAARPGWLTIPGPPALDLAPTSSRAVVTVVVGDEAEACFASSGPLMRRFANRVGADFIVLRWPGHPAWRMASKYAIPRVLDHYERLLYADADVEFRPRCVNPFDLCPPDEFGACDELPWHRANATFGREEAYQQFRAEHGFKRVEHLPWMFNAGVMVVPRKYRDILMPPAAIRPGHCAEQDHSNARLLDSGMRFYDLSRKCNWQNWTDHGFKSAPPDAVLHWSGAGKDRISRAEQMRRRAAPYLAPFDPLPPSHEWEIDRRHLLWLSDELLSGRHRRVLEIGSFRGYSTSAFLHALRVGAVDEVHLCDVAPTPELLALIDGVPGVTLHACPSVEVLDRDGAARFDLVFVDGDHSAAACTAEARLLIAAGVRCVMAHDTAGLHHCEGPPLLKAALERAGYALTEDAEQRPGEGTRRGMMRAAR